MKALIQGTRICQIEDTEFPVHSSLKWVSIPRGLSVTTSWTYENGSFVEPIAYVPSSIDQIKALEEQITPRRLREALLGDERSKTFINDINDQIATLRATL